jgi:hypothetical protein
MRNICRNCAGKSRDGSRRVGSRTSPRGLGAIATPWQPTYPSRAFGWSSLTSSWGFPCCVRFPYGLWVLFGDVVEAPPVTMIARSTSCSARPNWRGPKSPFRLNSFATHGRAIDPMHDHGKIARDRHPSAIPAYRRCRRTADPPNRQTRMLGRPTHRLEGCGRPRRMGRPH